jgi:formylglycine-generating enzyme required for sulfatase activity
MGHWDSILQWTREQEAARFENAVAREANPSAASHGHGAWPETFTNPFDGSLMRLIPGGTFFMGSTSQETEAARRMDADGERFDLTPETPQFDLFVPAFYLGVFPVTNEQFTRFLSERQPRPELFDLWVFTLAHIEKPPRAGGPYRVEPGFERHPAAHITWFGAEAYCHWAKLRLPTEVEWEKAARGTDARLFPWGNEWRDDCLRWRREKINGGAPTTEVDAHPEGRSPYGIFQMAGNVAEWCEDWFQLQAYADHVLGNRRPPQSGDERVLRGGHCLQSRRLEFRCAMRQHSTPVFLSVDFTGIRCACDLPVLANLIEMP